MQKIIKLIITDEDGLVREWEGEGFVTVLSAQEKRSGGMVAKIVGTQITANLLVPIKE